MKNNFTARMIQYLSVVLTTIIIASFWYDIKNVDIVMEIIKVYSYVFFLLIINDITEVEIGPGGLKIKKGKKDDKPNQE